MHPDPQVRASPIFPVRDLRRALDHYSALGFRVQTYDAGYGFAAWLGLELHVVLTPELDPARNPSAAFLHVPDADAVAAAWAHVEATTAPEDMPWGVREGRHVDPDGNLLRFGSPLAFGG
jgi:catechol 2,3-dioxygenase-like lactoylglutathione lyase family enzyme